MIPMQSENLISCPCSQHIVVELITHDLVKQLQEQNKDLLQQLDFFQKRFHDIELRYGYEVHLNNELCDLLRENGISFRALLDNRNR